MNARGPGGRLFRKYVVVLLVLVGGVLMASSLVELYFSYRETQRAIVRVERAKAVAAAVGIEQFLKEIEEQVRETTRTASDDPDASQVGQGKLGFRQGLGAAMAEQRELDFLRVLRNVPAISELSHLDLSGKEQLRVSRLDPDVVGSQEDFSRAPKFVEAQSGKTYWSPVYFRNESAPYVTLAVPVGKYAVEVTTAEVSLGAILKLVSQIEVGPGGYAYVVDSRNHLVAHPDSRTLRDRRDLSALEQVTSARAEGSGPTADPHVAMVADGLGGGRVLAAHAAIAPLGWLVFVERPAADAYAPLRAPIIRSVVIFVLGLALSILASLFLARRMVAPIRVLQEGAARIGAGKLDQPIELHTGDEIETLATSFNRMTASLKESYEGLEQKVEARTRELAGANRDLTEALDQQTATSEILRVLSSSPTDTQPVFDAIARESLRLCGASYSVVGRYDGELLHLAAYEHVRPEGVEAVRHLFPMRPDRSITSSRCILERTVVHVPDVLEDPAYDRSIALGLQNRSTLAVPMLRHGEPIGSISVGRLEPQPFSDKQIVLLQTFADQAVIAIENVRLFKELELRNRDLTEALEQQTATSEILQVLSSSPTDAQPVFDTIVRSAVRLCDGLHGSVFRFDGELIQLVAQHNHTPEWLEALRQLLPMRPDARLGVARAILTRSVVHVEDVLADREYALEVAQASGYRSVLAVPLLREGHAIGAIAVNRAEPGSFSAAQIALLQTFADQAVIAIENVRLFKELEVRNRDLTEALEQQTATSEILRVISRSPTDIQPVFEAIVENASRLCEAEFSAVTRFDDGLLHLVAVSNMSPAETEAYHSLFPRPPLRSFAIGRAFVEGRPVHIEDVLTDPDYDPRTLEVLQRAANYRTYMGIPMVRHGVPIGAIGCGRREMRPFSATQIELVKTFADQAVIAVENVRLFTELEARNRDLTETLEQQTATSDILRVISSSPTDVRPVFDAVARSAARLCEAFDAVVYRVEGDVLHPVSHHGSLTPGPVPVVPGTVGGRSVIERQLVHVRDLQAEVGEFPDGARISQRERTRSFVSVPLLREGAAIGTIGVRRFEIRPFSEKQLALLRTFADQAVIAIENVRLFKELEVRTQELTRSVEELRALGEVVQAVSSTLDLETVLVTIVSRAVQLSSSYSGIVYEFDEAKQAFYARATHRVTPEYLETLRAAPIRLGEGAMGRAGLVRGPVEVADVEGEAHLVAPQVRGLLAREGVRALLAVPFVQEDRLLGGLVVLRRESGSFSTEVVATLETFATQSALAIQNARLFREIDEKSRALEELSRNQEQLHRLSTALQEPLSLTEQLTRVLDAARQVVGLDRIYVWTLGPTADGLMVTAQAGFGERDWRDLAGVTIPLSEAGALAAVCREGAPRLFTDENPLPAEYRLRPPYSALAGVRVKSFLVIPMIARGRTVGVLAADNRTSRAAIPAHTVDLLQTFAAQAAVAVENARLFQEIQDKSRELELASRHKSQFLANMSHELRTPMNAVLGYTDLILDDIFGEVPAPIRETLERVKTNGQHLLGLINDVLDLSKMEAGQLTLSLGDYGMGEVVHAVVSAVESLAAGKNLALKAIVAPDLPPGHGDERRLTQVLLNLAGNAIKFTDTGQVSLEARVSDGAFLVSVSDTGPGISEADQQKIFEEFQQADSSSTRAKGGSGLGLAISRRIVELHGGRLWVESALGEGATFHFTVPLRVERPAERA